MIKGVLPETFGQNSQAVCFMLYDWPRPITAGLLSLLEEIFIEFGEIPSMCSGSSGDFSFNGNYRRLKKKLASVLNDPDDGFRDIKLLSDTTMSDEPFFPSNIVFALSSGSCRQRKAILSIRKHVGVEINDFVQKIGPLIFEFTGEAYGAVCEFPAAFGPDSYLASIQAIPKGAKWGGNKDYTARITRWRDNTNNPELRAARGYFREVYPINFLLDAHLNMPFLGRPLRSFVERNGELAKLDFNQKLYRWDVAPERITEVQEKLEGSGLVLSSACSALLKN